jgi:hypothetical protein
LCKESCHASPAVSGRSTPNTISQQNFPAGSHIIIDLDGPLRPQGRYFVCLLDTFTSQEKGVAEEVRL